MMYVILMRPTLCKMIYELPRPVSVCLTIRHQVLADYPHA